MRTRSASPKSVSFSPVLERKYSANKGPSQPEPISTDWKKYFNDFSSYLGKSSDLVHGNESISLIVRPCAILVACLWSVWESMP